jgi:hypothetical protein
MYINPFVAGVLWTVLVELIIIIAVEAIGAIKGGKKNG